MTPVVSSARVMAGVLPAVLLVLAVLLVALIALVLSTERRRFALSIVDRMLTLAAVLVGADPMLSIQP